MEYKEIQNLKGIRLSALRQFIIRKIKRYGSRKSALAVQNALHLLTTGAFDRRTLTVLYKPMKRTVYERFKDSVNAWLERNKRTVY